MQIEGALAAYGVTECYRGHRLRNRRGTCLVCDPARVAFVKRAEISGYVCLAEERSPTFMKIGCSGDPQKRIRNANYEGWGGYSDWRVVALVWSEQSGRLEEDMKARFLDSREPLPWIHTR